MIKGINLIGFLLAGFILFSCNPDYSYPPVNNQTSLNDTSLTTNIYYRWLELESVKLSNVEIINDLNKQINLSDITKDGPQLAFFLSEGSCFECVSKQIDFISSYLSDSLSFPIVVISTSQNLRSVYALLREKGLDLPYYSSNFQNIGFDRNLHPGPLFFVLDTALRCKFIYEPNIQLQNITHKYLNKVNNMFFSNQ